MKIFNSFLIICFCFGTQLSNAQDKSIRLKHYNINNSKLALNGYDPISYFSYQPKQGGKEFVALYEGLIYRFTTKKNKELFLSDPEKYEPMYGGWCAYAMGNTGEKVDINPITYKIIDGKLYLFYNKFFNNTLTDWNKDEETLKKKADINWSQVIK